MKSRDRVNDLDADFVHAFNGGTMTDIVERLRKGRSVNEWVSEELAHEAADEIEALRYHLTRYANEVERLREALETVLEQTIKWNEAVEKIIGRQPSTGIDLERVRQALAPTGDACRVALKDKP